MAAAERRRGRRDNGLDAADWRPVEDLDPRVSEEVLDALATQGIAAYVQPAMDVDPITRSASVPSRPTDRLYVDRGRLQDARDWLRRFREAGPATGDEDVDATFARIVAGLDIPADPTADATTQGTDTTEGTDTTQPPARPVDGRHVTEPSLLDGLDTFGADLPDEEPPETFVPPPPPPLPLPSGQTVFGTLAVVGGLVMVIVRPEALPFDQSSTMLLGFAAMLAGAAALIQRLRPGSDPDDQTRPDDGAKV